MRMRKYFLIRIICGEVESSLFNKNYDGVNLGAKLRRIAKNSFSKLETYYLIAIFAVLVYVLFAEKVGIADNGDFNRVLIPLFMDYPENLSYHQLYFDFVNPEYAIKNPFPQILPIYLNTHILFVFIAKILNVIFYSASVFKTGFLSIIYILVFLYAIYLIFRAIKSDKIWINLITYSLITLVLVDRGNILYFGSLYAEPAAFVMFVLAVGTLMNILRFRAFSKYNICLFFVALTLFLGAKVQYAPLSVLFIPMAVMLARLAEGKTAKKLIKFAAAFMVVISMGVYLIQPAYLDEVTTFDSVFCGILVGDEEKDRNSLSELGLLEEYYVLAGMDGFEEQYPIDIHSENFRENFYDEISKADMVFYYLKHFDRLWENLKKTAEVSFMNLPEYLGNRTEEVSSVRQSYENFSLYDGFKKMVIPKNIFFVIGFFVIYFISELYILINCKNSSRRIWNVFLMSCIVFCGIQFVLPTIGNGGIDIAKQLYMFNVVFDILFLNMLCGVILKLKNIKIGFWRN